MSATAALLQAVLDDPDDVASRRVYGDALAAAGDLRGELIQVQCDLETTAPDDPRFRPLVIRERELLDTHGKTWLAPYKAFLFRPEFRRGMIEDAFVNTKKFIPVARELLAKEPVVELGMRGLTQANAAALGARPELARLRSLRISESSLGARGISSLITDRLTHLRRLNLYQAGADDSALAHLGTTVFAQLERLVLDGNPITPSALGGMLKDERLRRLGYLSLKWLVRGDRGAAWLANNLALPALTHLDLGSNDYVSRDLKTLATNETFSKLRGLRLDENELDDGAIGPLAQLSKLEVLDLSSSTLGEDGLAALARSTLPLRSLKLYQCGVGDDELASLCAGKFPALMHLDLGYGGVSSRGLAILGRAGFPLAKLDLWANKIGDHGIRTLTSTALTDTLREITLGYCDVGDAGVVAIAAATWPKLERLVFRGGSIGAAGARALAESTTMPALRSIKLEETHTPKRALAPLRKRGIALDLDRLDA